MMPKKEFFDVHRWFELFLNFFNFMILIAGFFFPGLVHSWFCLSRWSTRRDINLPMS